MLHFLVVTARANQTVDNGGKLRDGQESLERDRGMLGPRRKTMARWIHGMGFRDNMLHCVGRIRSRLAFRILGTGDCSCLLLRGSVKRMWLRMPNVMGQLGPTAKDAPMTPSLRQQKADIRKDVQLG